MKKRSLFLITYLYVFGSMLVRAQTSNDLTLWYNKDAADVFMEFLQSDEALDVFKVAGFTVNSQQ